MWKWLLIIGKLAATANTRRTAILFILELLKRFDRSIVNAENQAKSKRTGKAGFVYVIRDISNGERFKTGYRAKPPWRDRQLRSELGESGDFILIIPAKNASALEISLRRAYAKHCKKNEWFSLNDMERREILVIAALVKVAVHDELGMSAVDQEIVQLAADLLRQLQEFAQAFGNRKTYARGPSDQEEEASEAETEFDDFSDFPSFGGNWQSVLDENYRELPKLKGKRGYICIIRDNDAKLGKTYLVNHPVLAIQAAFAERRLGFPLEVVTVLKVDNKKKAKVDLLSGAEQDDGNDWVKLSDKELGDIKRSASEAYTHGSIYVTPKTHWGLKSLASDAYKCYPKIEKPAGYVCVVQGVKLGKLRKIWTTRQPMRLASSNRLALRLNNPHDTLKAEEPIRFNCIIKAKYAESFQDFLHKRYRAHRKRNGWFELEDAQLKEIRRFGK